MSADMDWDELYLDIEANSEGIPREMVRRAYLAGKAAAAVETASRWKADAMRWREHDQRQAIAARLFDPNTAAPEEPER